jgi:hypothetical protein
MDLMNKQFANQKELEQMKLEAYKSMLSNPNALASTQSGTNTGAGNNAGSQFSPSIITPNNFTYSQFESAINSMDPKTLDALRSSISTSGNMLVSNAYNNQELYNYIINNASTMNPSDPAYNLAKSVYESLYP